MSNIMQYTAGPMKQQVAMPHHY